MADQLVAEKSSIPEQPKVGKEAEIFVDLQMAESAAIALI
jgi:hypothetical protein